MSPRKIQAINNGTSNILQPPSLKGSVTLAFFFFFPSTYAFLFVATVLHVMEQMQYDVNRTEHTTVLI
jgi:hypothetical protein